MHMVQSAVLHAGLQSLVKHIQASKPALMFAEFDALLPAAPAFDAPPLITSDSVFDSFIPDKVSFNASFFIFS
jgi:hypothetical protein